MLQNILEHINTQRDNSGKLLKSVYVLLKKFYWEIRYVFLFTRTVLVSLRPLDTAPNLKNRQIIFKGTDKISVVINYIKDALAVKSLVSYKYKDLVIYWMSYIF